MSIRFFAQAIALLALASLGCVQMTAVQAQPNKAWLINGGPFGTQVYNCFEAGGNPQCVPVVEEPAK